MGLRQRRKALRDALLHRLLLAIGWGGRRLSLSTARAVGRRLGRIAWRVVPRERAKALESLSIAFPSLDEGAREALAREMFEHLGVSLLEVLWLPNLDRATFEKTTEVVGLEHLRAAQALGRGVLMITGHCGNWEWLGATVALLGFDLSVIAREMSNSRLNDFMIATRASVGEKTIERGSPTAAREMLQSLKRGALLGFLIDQNIRAENVDVPFFGRMAPTPVGAAKIAIRAEAPCVPCFVERRGERQVVRFDPAVETKKGDDPVELTARLTAMIEEQIRHAPAQWVWMHQRWRPRRD